MTIIVTGGAGFIGGNFIHYYLKEHPEDRVICLDKLTYAGNLSTLKSVMDNPNFRFVKADICDREAVEKLFEEEKPDIVVNFAAESHVDRSIENPEIFLQTNIIGTEVLMDACRKYGIQRYHQVSTDEVYGDLPLDRPDLFFTEETPIHTSSPYSSSKAGADLLVLAYHRTYGLPVTISRCSNNYGPYHFPEKLIPLMIANALNDKPLPVYGEGINVRDWLYVEDHCRAIDLIIHNGRVGEVYNVGGHNEMKNIDIVKLICKELGKPESLITYVTDRKGHDMRYEYDVPMAKGDANGYYRDITDIMSVMLSKALKDNPYIKFAVLTGCLRIAKESIFTGLNNPKMYSILDYGYQEYFGFTDSEIDRLLADTGFTEYKEKIKEWYDGYRFGDTDIYCPWDVLNYVSDLQQKAGVEPKDYWANTSGNEIIRKYLESENVNPHSDFETLLAGRCIKKTIAEDITYENLLSSEENFWSVLLMTGYLTVVPEDEVNAEDISSDADGLYLRLVNNEIMELFSRTVVSWFKNKMLKEDRTELFKAIWNGDTDTITDELCGFLGDSISYYDYHEVFYHAFLTGLFSGVKGISVKSNSETGTGRADVVLQYPRKGLVAIFEFKSAKSEAAMSKRCDEALKQIDVNKYSFPFRKNTIFKYGIAFFEKQCLVKKG